MGEIKSAFERAMERTEDIRSDREALHKHEARNEGKRLFAKLRAEDSFDVSAAIKAYDKDRRRWVREGYYEVVRANLTLPQAERDLDELDLIRRALESVARDRASVKMVIEQLKQFFSRYLDERERYIEQVRAQFEPQIRRKEQQLAQQYGRPVRIDPANDPEFSRILQENLGALQNHYRDALQQALDQLDTMIER